MATKTKITTFFKPVTKRDKISGNENDSAEANILKQRSHVSPTQVAPDKRKRDSSPCTPNKRLQVSTQDEVISPLSPGVLDKVVLPLSPEQKARSDLSKLKAKLLLLCKELPVLSSNIGISWFSALSDNFGLDWFGNLSNYVSRERQQFTVYPEPGEVWEWTTRTDISQVKVVILGQDPYHGPGQAHGLCFSVKPGVTPPPSLVNIYKELESDIEGFSRPSHGYLAGWADQGVLLLNNCLTVRKGEANSHKDRGWEKLTDAVIRWISKNLSGVVFLLWGSHAQKKAMVVDRSKHHLLKSVHPSPLSAYRGFLGCGHFSQCNKLLSQQGKQPINWCNIPDKP